MNLRIICHRRTLSLMLSAAMLAGIVVFAPVHSSFLFGLIRRVIYVADTMFHELGHAFFYWLFGTPALPSIFTLFARDQAGGMTIPFDRSWLLQGLSFAALAYGCLWTKRNYPSWLWGAIAMTLLIVAVAFTPYYRIVILYMGHGGSIFMGGFFLFWAWEYLSFSETPKGWTNAFFGFYLIFNNLHLAYRLMTSALFRQEYGTSTFGGAVDNDFVAITDQIWRWSVQGIATFTVAYCMLALIVPAFIVCYLAADDTL